MPAEVEFAVAPDEAEDPEDEPDNDEEAVDANCSGVALRMSSPIRSKMTRASWASST